MDRQSTETLSCMIEKLTSGQRLLYVHIYKLFYECIFMVVCYLCALTYTGMIVCISVSIDIYNILMHLHVVFIK